MAEQKCLRSMSCTCPLCAGFDVASLMSISRGISSNIQYDDPEDGEPPPAAPAARAVVNSPPPVPLARKRPPVANTPPVRAAAAVARPASQTTTGATEEAPPPQDARMEAVADTLSKMEVDAEGGGPSVEDVLPKLSDKNWKLRKEGFEELKAICERPGIRSLALGAVLELFPKMCEDANASAMEAGIAAVLAYTVNVEPFQKDIVPGVMKRITDKGFSSRPGIVKLCEELVSAFVEAGAAEDTVAALLEGTTNRKPKVPPACLNALLEALKAFGPRVIPVQAVKASLPKLLESTANGVRPLAMSIVVEVHRWTGPALVQDIVSNLRQAQQTEYEQLTKDITSGQATATKYVRGAKKPAAIGSTLKGGSARAAAVSSTPEPAAFDPREFAETVDLLAKLPRTEFQAKLKETKWSEKVAALKIVLDLVGPVPKLANGDYYELVSTLKLMSNDSNVNIVAKSVEVLGALADGLRKNFTQHARTMYPEILRKLSDKKTVVLNASNNTLDLFLQHSMTIDMMMDDLKTALDSSKNKSPQARVQTLGFMARAAEKRYISLDDKGLVLEFGTLFVTAIDDTDPTVRKAGVDAMVTLVKASDQVNGWLQGKLDDISRKNPRSFKAIQQGLGGATPTPSTGVPSRPSSASSQKSAESVDVDISGPPPPAVTSSAVKPPVKKPVRGPSSRFGAKPNEEAASKPAAAKPTALSRKASASGSSTGGGGSSGGGSGDFTPIGVSVSPEEAADIVTELNIEDFATVTAGFASAKWMERKASIEALENFAASNSGSMSMRTIEALTVYLSKQVKDFKDSNINVLKSAFQAIGSFAEHTTSKFPRGVVCLVVPSATDKIGDRKASESIRTMIVQFCEVTSPSYTLGCMMNHIVNVKTPLAHIEALNVVTECVKDFGVAMCNPRAVIDYAKGSVGLESPNIKVRSGATTLLGAMYSQLGPALLPILNLESWKPALASIVEGEFKKVGFDEKNALASVKRQVKDADEVQSGGADPGALFGRTDISAQITKELMADMKCEDDKTAWKKRAAAMDTVQSICEGAGCMIEFTKPVQEVLRGLKARLNDSNANLKVKAAQVIGVVASSVGPDIGKMSKIMGASLVSGVGDNKKNMQSAAVEALHKWVRHNNETSTACMESLLSPLSEGLLNTVGRAELLGWAAEHLQNCGKIDLSCLVVPTVQCLMDKSPDAREKAQSVLVEVMKSVGKDTILTTGCRDVKPAQMRSLRPMIDKVCEIVDKSPAAPSAAPNPPRPTLPPAPINTTQPPEAPAQRTSSIARGGKASPGGSRASGLGTPTRIGSGIRSQLARPSSSARQLSIPDSTENSEGSSLLRPNTGKPARLAKAQYNKWVFDSTSVSEMNLRKGEIDQEWKPFMSPDFHSKLFASTLEKGMMAALDDLTVCISAQPEEVVSALDWILKWCTLRIVDNNVQALAKLLEVLVKLLEMLRASEYMMDDAEAAILLPFLLQESGQSKPRFRVRFRDIMKLVVDVYSVEKYVVYLAECINTSKNMKSRCECIDMIEFIVSVHGIHVVGKRYIKEVGKYVTAHEKELRESALNALVAVYLRSDGDQDRFFRFVGITTQQGMDLLSARFKHLPPSSFQGTGNGSDATPQLQQRQSSFGLVASASTGIENPTRNFAPVDRSLPASGVTLGGGFSVAVPEVSNECTPSQPVESDDVNMDATLPNAEGSGGTDEANAIHDLVLRPIEQLVTASKEIISEASPEYTDGVDALKGLYAIMTRPEGDAEIEFLRCYVNEILIRLCDCIHASFRGGPSQKPISIMVLSLSLSSLSVILGSEVVDNIQRYAVERVLLEMCSNMLDPRMSEFASVSNSSAVDLTTMPPEKKRLFFVFKALFKAVRRLTENVKAGDVYPSVINLLQRVLRNDVGDYNMSVFHRHLYKRDSLDQLIGRMLLQISRIQANALNPFEGIDVFGVLMQMHSFFATMPRAEALSAEIAMNAMEEALRLIATSLINSRPGVFEASLGDLPVTSPVRERLVSMGIISSQQLHATTISGLRATSAMPVVAQSISNNDNTSQESDMVTRRLIGASSTESTDATSSSSLARPVAARDSLKARMMATSSPVTARSSFAAGGPSRLSVSSRLGARAGSTASNPELGALRERLSKFRNANGN